MIKKNQYQKYSFGIFESIITLCFFYLIFMLKKRKNVNEFPRRPHFRKKRYNSRKIIRRKNIIDRNNESKGFIVKPQPGDGLCLYHSLSYGLGNKTNAKNLRKEICNFIQKNQELKISGIPLKEWIKWDSEKTVDEYAKTMAVSGWGGAIEMAAFSKMKNVNVQVFEECNRDYKLISEFKEPTSLKTIRVLYRGKNHYDAIDKH